MILWEMGYPMIKNYSAVLLNEDLIGKNQHERRNFFADSKGLFFLPRDKNLPFSPPDPSPREASAENNLSKTFFSPSPRCNIISHIYLHGAKKKTKFNPADPFSRVILKT